MLKASIKRLNLGFLMGDVVTIEDNNIYGNYSQFANLHKKYATRYQYKTWKLNEDAKGLRVIGVHRHVWGKGGKNRYDMSKYVVVVQDNYKRVYFVGNVGVRRLGVE